MKIRVFNLFVLIVFGGLLTIFHSCKPKPPKENNDVFLQVNFSNTLGINWIYLKELNVRDLRTIDSFDVRKTGRHTFRFTPQGPGFYIVQTKQYSFITLLLEPGEQVELFADGKKMKKDYQVKGSPGSLILRDYFYHTERNLLKIDSLKEVFSKARYSDNFPAKRAQLDSAYYNVYNDQRNFVINLARRNNKSIASVFLINQRFGPDLIIQEKKDFPLFAELDSCLMAIYPNNKHVLDHHQRVSALKRLQTEIKLAEERLEPGNPAPEIRLNDQNNKPFTTTSLNHKAILLYFWTSGTGKARQDHALMKEFYRANKAKGLEIVSVSLDQNVELWKAALKIDRLPWVTLIDPAGVKSPVARLFALQDALPYYYVIDKEGSMAGKGESFSEVKNLVVTALSK